MNRNRFFTLLLVLALVLALFSGTALAEEPEDYVAKNGENSYTSLQDAIGAASSGDTIEILKDFVNTSTVLSSSNSEFGLLIEAKDLTINGNGYTVETTARRGLGITGTNINVTINDLTIINSSGASYPRCVQVVGPSPTVTLNNVHLVVENISAHSQPLSVYGSGNSNEVTINMNSCSVDTGVISKGYSIIIYAKTNLNLNAVNIAGGFAAIYLKNDSNGYSAGSKIVVENSLLSSTNIYGGTSNNFGTIVLEGNGEDTTVELANTAVEAVATGDAYQRAIVFSAYVGAPSTNHTVTVNDGCEFFLDGENTGLASFNDIENADNLLALKGGYYPTDPSEYVADGFVTLTSDNSAFLFTVAASTETAAEVAPAAAGGEVSETIPEEQLAAANAVAAAINSSADSITTDGIIEALVNDLSQHSTLTPSALNSDDKAALEALIPVGAAIEDAVIVHEPFLDVSITGINLAPEADEAVLSFDLSAHYNVLATFAEDLSTLTYEEAADNNAVFIGSVALDVSKSVDVRLPISQDVYTALTSLSNLFVKHDKNNTEYFYPATLEVSENEASYYLCFTSVHGFSPFAVMADSRSAAVQFENIDGTVTYTPTNVGDELPVPAEKSGYYYSGWEFYSGDELIAASSKTLTSALLSILSEAYDDVPLSAKPIYSHIIHASAPDEAECEGGAGCPSAHFNDVLSTNWFHHAVDYVVEHDVMRGVSSARFAPTTVLSHAMMLQMLWNLDGNPAASAPSGSVISSGAWYYSAIVWAEENGITAGYLSGNINPKANITREEMAVMLYNYCEKNGISLPTTREGNFADAESVSDFAAVAVKAMYNAEILNGRRGNNFDPQGSALRSEAAQMMKNFRELIKK